ncbi:hypothetical protein ABZ446_01810 [Streptomyces sp. NPDC005813]|uniref:hypothetical protein n=1 Tax=Streptomyces sp. NPDC005813 TaxID=3155592 RepID=UPI00340456BE
MKAIIFGAVIATLLLLWPAALPLAAALAGTLLAQPVVLGVLVGVLVRPALARRIRRWTT